MQNLTKKTNRILLFLLLCGIGIFINKEAAAQRKCGTSLAIEQALQKHPGLAEAYRQIKERKNVPPPDFSIARGPAKYRIPVVVHIVNEHPEEITDQQVLSQIAVLNEDYNLENADQGNAPAVWTDLKGSMSIEFCLAQRKPDGTPTNGIERTVTTKSSFSIQDAVRGVKHLETGGADSWGGKEYLNIWVCNLNGDFLGLGTPPVLYPDEEQGVVIHTKAFGRVGDLEPDFNKGRSTTHEIGHFLNLLHPWGEREKDCSIDDFIEDTPEQFEAVYGTPVFPQTDACSPDEPGIMINNFMGYVNDAAMNMFTLGQVERAENSLLLDRSELMSSNACEPVDIKANDAKLQTVISPKGKLCSQTFTPVLTLVNFGSNTLETVQVHYQTNDGEEKSYTWQGNLPSLDSTTLSLPEQSVDYGEHQFTVYTELPNGEDDERKENDTLRANFRIDRPELTPYEEDFEDQAFPPKGWSLSNPDGQLTWELIDLRQPDNQVIGIRNFDYASPGTVDDLLTPEFDLQNQDSALLIFDLAASVFSPLSGRNVNWDTLEIFMSFDCGQSGETVYKKWGKDLMTTEKNTGVAFVPRSNEWRTDTVNLTPYLEGKPFRLVFRNINNHQNNIYLDQVQVNTLKVNPILREEEILIVPNPVKEQLQVRFLNHPKSLLAVSLYNMLGQRVLRKQAGAIDENNSLTFNVKNLSPGIYLVRLDFEDRKEVKKILKID